MPIFSKNPLEVYNSTLACDGVQTGNATFNKGGAKEVAFDTLGIRIYLLNIFNKSTKGRVCKAVLENGQILIFKSFGSSVVNFDTSSCPLYSCAVKHDMTFITDSSGSMSLSDFRQENYFIINVTSLLPISNEDVRVSYIQFGTAVISHFNYTTDRAIINRYIHAFLQNLLYFSITNLTHMGSSTYMGAAFRVADQVYQDHARKDVPHFTILLIDGVCSPSVQCAISYPYVDAIKSYYQLSLL